jgi:hypothetical protein
MVVLCFKKLLLPDFSTNLSVSRWKSTVKSHVNKNEVEGVKHDSCFVHVLEDPFIVLLEEVNNPNVFYFFRFGFMDEILNELSAKKIWNKQVQRKQTVDKMFHGYIGIMISLDWQFVSTVRVGRSV